MAKGANRYMAGNAWNKQAYSASTAFREAQIVVRQELLQAAKEHPVAISKFLSWMRSRPRGTTRTQILLKIRRLAKDDEALADVLRLYSGFVLRFRVYLKLITINGSIDVQETYTQPRLSQLRARVSGGKLAHLPLEPDEDYRDRFASIGGLPAKIRRAIKEKGSPVLLSKERENADAKLIRGGILSPDELDYLRQVQRSRSCNPEDARLRFVEVELGEASALAKLLDLVYDPLSITFLLVDTKPQMRLLCLVGELVTDDGWKQLGAVRGVFSKVISGKTSAGAPVNFDQFAQDIARLPRKGKITTDLVIDTVGRDEIRLDAQKRVEKRLQRAKLRRDHVLRQLPL